MLTQHTTIDGQKVLLVQADPVKSRITERLMVLTSIESLIDRNPYSYHIPQRRPILPVIEKHLARLVNKRSGEVKKEKELSEQDLKHRNIQIEKSNPNLEWVFI